MCAQVNLDSDAYRIVHERIADNDISIDLFDDASAHIFHLMATDSFVIFKSQREERSREALAEVERLGLVW